VNSESFDLGQRSVKCTGIALDFLTDIRYGLLVVEQADRLRKRVVDDVVRASNGRRVVPDLHAQQYTRLY
jgi:hypothetical protein